MAKNAMFSALFISVYEIYQPMYNKLAESGKVRVLHGCFCVKKTQIQGTWGVILGELPDTSRLQLRPRRSLSTVY